MPGASFLWTSFEEGLRQAARMLKERDLLPAELAKLLDVVGKYCVVLNPEGGGPSTIRVVFGDDEPPK